MSEIVVNLLPTFVSKYFPNILVKRINLQRIEPNSVLTAEVTIVVTREMLKDLTEELLEYKEVHTCQLK